MNVEEQELRRHIDAKAARMYSSAMYRRLKKVVDGWVREERAKTRFAVLALASLAVLWPAALLVGWLAGAPLLESLLVGFVLWVAIVIALTWRLSRRGSTRAVD